VIDEAFQKKVIGGEGGREEGLMHEKLKMENLVSEAELSKTLKISRRILWGYRNQGCPWIDLGGHVFYHSQLFMEWVLKRRLKVSESK